MVLISIWTNKYLTSYRHRVLRGHVSGADSGAGDLPSQEMPSQAFRLITTVSYNQNCWKSHSVCVGGEEGLYLRIYLFISFRCIALRELWKRALSFKNGITWEQHKLQWPNLVCCFILKKSQTSSDMDDLDLLFKVINIQNLITWE